MESTTFKQADTRKTSSLLKKYLQSKYGVKFSIRTEKYSMGSSLHVSYKGGPDEKIIVSEVSRLQHGWFDGMTDMYNYSHKDTNRMVIDGYMLETQKFVFVNQEIPEETSFKLARKLSENHSFSCGSFEVPKLENFSEFYTNFSERFGSAWNWSQFIYQNFTVRNFVTDNLDEIEILSCERDEENFSNFVFTYRYNGSVYSTSGLSVSKPEVEKKPVSVANNIEIVNYSEKAVAVIGGTYEIREGLKAIGGKFNPSLTVNGERVKGWIFPKSKENDIADLLISYNES